MERFLTDSHRGAAVLASYRSKGVGHRMTTDFTRTVGEVSSAIFLVSPGSPSDRERMVLSWAAADHCIHDYRNTVVTADMPHWCLANNPALHNFVKRKLEDAGLHDPSRFSLSPVEGAGEMVAFKYTGGTPRHVVFPIGSETVNWLTMVRSSLEMGSILSGHAGVGSVLGHGFGIHYDEEAEKVDVEETRRRVLAHKRARIWRTLDFVEEACQRAGMLQYNPLSAGAVRFRSEVESTHVKTRHDHNLLFLGDSFSKESVLFADIVVGGRTSDFWAALSAVVRHKRIDDGGGMGVASVDDNPTFGNDVRWHDVLSQRTDAQGYRGVPHRSGQTGEVALLDAIEAHVYGPKRSTVLAFVHNVLTQEQRDAMGNLTNSPASRTALADALLYAPARILTWTLLHSLLSIVKFNVLHLLGYEAHRQLIFKLFIPAVIAIFLRDSCLSDTFGHGALNLQLLRERAGGQTVANILNRTPTASVPPRNYCQFDPASLSGELNASASIPFAINMGSVANKVAADLNVLEVCVTRTLELFEAKNKVAADHRAVRRSARVANNRRAGKRPRLDANDESDEHREATAPRAENDRDDGDGGCDEDSRPNTFVTALQLLDPMYGGRVPRDEVPYVTVENEQRLTTLRAIQEKLTARYNRGCARLRGQAPTTGEDALVSDVAFAGATIKAIMNTLEKAFKLVPGTILNSVHLNERTGEGAWKHPDTQTTAESMVRDAMMLENKPSAVAARDGFDPSDAKHMSDRFVELVMDPPTVAGIKNYAVAERVQQNELMLTTLPLNPVFGALYRAEGLLQRVVVLTNIVKYMNAVTVCLVDGDLPTLVETRKGVKRAMTKGDKKGFDYRKAGTTPVGTLRGQLLPPCIAGLKSIGARVAGGRHGAGGRQTCGHAFCRSLRFLFYSLKPESAHASLTDAASDVTLLGLARFCSLNTDGGWHERLIDPVVKGTKEWTAQGRYSPLESEGDTDGRGAKDIFHTIRTAFVDEDILSVDGHVGPDGQAISLAAEMLKLKAEGFRRESFSVDRPTGKTEEEEEEEEEEVEEDEENSEEEVESDQEGEMMELSEETESTRADAAVTAETDPPTPDVKTGEGDDRWGEFDIEEFMTSGRSLLPNDESGAAEFPIDVLDELLQHFDIPGEVME